MSLKKIVFRRKLKRFFIDMWTDIFGVMFFEVIHGSGWSLERYNEREMTDKIYELIHQLPEYFRDVPFVMSGVLGKNRYRKLEKVTRDLVYEQLNCIDEFCKSSWLTILTHEDPKRSNPYVKIEFKWRSNPPRPHSYTEFNVFETFFYDQAFVEKYIEFIRKYMEVAKVEYFIATHIRDWQGKRFPPKHIDKKIDKGEGIPYNSIFVAPAICVESWGWLMVFGPKYVEFFGKDKIDSLEVYHREYLADGTVILVLYENPMLWETKEAREREAKALEILGREAFFDKYNPYRVAPGPDYPEVYRWEVERGEEWWKGGSGRMDAYLVEDGILVVSKDLKTGEETRMVMPLDWEEVMEEDEDD